MEVEAWIRGLGGEAASLEVMPCAIRQLFTFHSFTFHFAKRCRSVTAIDVVVTTRARRRSVELEIALLTKDTCVCSHFHEFVVIKHVEIAAVVFDLLPRQDGFDLPVPRNIEDGFHAGFFAPCPDLSPVSPSAENQIQRVQKQAFAGSCFPGTRRKRPEG